MSRGRMIRRGCREHWRLRLQQQWGVDATNLSQSTKARWNPIPIVAQRMPLARGLAVHVHWTPTSEPTLQPLRRVKTFQRLWSEHTTQATYPAEAAASEAAS